VTQDTERWFYVESYNVTIERLSHSKSQSSLGWCRVVMADERIDLRG
jgi:hypothetical protein